MEKVDNITIYNYGLNVGKKFCSYMSSDSGKEKERKWSFVKIVIIDWWFAFSLKIRGEGACGEEAKSI